MKNRTTIVLVNYHSESHIKRIISNLSQDSFNYVLIDNSGTLDLDSEEIDFQLVSPGRNVGFGAAVNLGFKEVDTEYVLFLNPDMKIEPSVLYRLQNLGDELVEFGILTPIVLEEKHQSKFLSAGKLPTLWSVFCHFSFLSRVFSSISFFSGLHMMRPKPNASKMLKVDWCSGAIMFMRSSVFKEVGGFSEEWFMYSEDLELCHRLKSQGLPVLIDTESEVTHIGQGSDESGVNEDLSKMWLNNFVDFYYTHMTSKNRYLTLAMTSLLASGFLARCALFSLAKLFSPKESHTIKDFYILRSWEHFTIAAVNFRGLLRRK